MKKWDKLPSDLRNDAVKPYYDILSRRGGSLVLKRIFDFVTAMILTVILLPAMGIIAVWIKCDSHGTVFFRFGTRHC